MNTRIFLSKIKSRIPAKWRDHYGWLKYRLSHSKFSDLTRQEVFHQIYQARYWGHGSSISGPGSEDQLAHDVITGLARILQEYQFSSMLDLPCGDFHWMSKVDLSGIKYIGADIVAPLIEQNRKVHGSAKHTFMVKDIVIDSLPSADLILVRDCFPHFSLPDIRAALNNILQARIPYILTTHFSQPMLNYDIKTGDWRPIYLPIPVCSY